VLKFSIPALLRRLLKLRSGPASIAVPMRQAMEEMGLTYLKLGQYLAMRFDLLPEEVCEEMNHLFEEVKPLSFEQVRRTVETELGGRLEEFYAEFGERHVAAASVAQVHVARTLDGVKVAVKVQRPGIERTFESDMRVLGLLASLADYLRVFGNLSVKGVVDQFSTWTRRELNFLTEGETADRLRRHATAHEVVPFVFWELTTRRVITFEFIEGVSMSQVAKMLDEGGLPRVREKLPKVEIEEALTNLSHASLRQLFVTGFFHGDPHPGNILLLEDNSVAFVDFGIFGELTPFQRELLAKHIESLAMGDFRASFRYYASLATPTEETDIRAFEDEGAEVLRRWYHASQNPDAPAEARHLGRVSGEMTSVVRRGRVLMGAETLLFWRAINALDSTALLLSPTFDLLAVLRRFFEEIRPGLSERLLGLVKDEERALAIAGLSLRGRDYVADILTRLGQGDYGGSVECDEWGGARGTADRRARLLAASLTGGSFAVLALNARLPPLACAACAGAAASLFALAFVGAYRR
jgi:ubiquinone biosynthesis protein